MARNGLQRHVTADKVKWALTFIAFVLVGVMLAGIICGWFDKDDKAEEFGEVETNILVFDDIGTKRTAYGADKQVWEENGITFTNLKGTGQDVGNYSAPIRMYAHSIVKVESTGMTKIVFYCNGPSYARALENSFEEGTDAAVSASEVTVTFHRATDVFNIIDLTAQVQLDKIAVTTLVTEDTEESVILTEEAAGHGVSLMSAVIPREEYDDYGIMPIAETAYTLTATVNADATVKAVNWSIAWESPDSAWASGKTVTDYVTVSGMGDLTATVSCLQAFGEHVIVSAVSRDDPQVKATCTCDYEKKVLGGRIEIATTEDFMTMFAQKDVTAAGGQFTDKKIQFGRDYYFRLTNLYGEGTCEPYVGTPSGTSLFYVTLSLNVKAKTELSKYGYTAGNTTAVDCSLKGYYAYKYPATSLDIEALKHLFGENASSNLFQTAVLSAQSAGFHEFLDLSLTLVSNRSVVYSCTLDIDAENIYTSVSSVELDQSSLTF